MTGNPFLYAVLMESMKAHPFHYGTSPTSRLTVDTRLGKRITADGTDVTKFVVSPPSYKCRIFNHNLRDFRVHFDRPVHL